MPLQTSPEEGFPPLEARGRYLYGFESAIYSAPPAFGMDYR